MLALACLCPRGGRYARFEQAPRGGRTKGLRVAGSLIRAQRRPPRRGQTSHHFQPTWNHTLTQAFIGDMDFRTGTPPFDSLERNGHHGTTTRAESKDHRRRAPANGGSGMPATGSAHVARTAPPGPGVPCAGVRRGGPRIRSWGPACGLLGGSPAYPLLGNRTRRALLWPLAGPNTPSTSSERIAKSSLRTA